MDESLENAVDCLASRVGNVMPVDLQLGAAKSLEKFGILVRYFAYEDYHAFLMWDQRRKCPVIAVNASDPREQRNFWLAHELGHLIINYRWLPFNEANRMPKTLLIIYCGEGRCSADERKTEEAMNEFAAGYLLPDSVLDRCTNHEQSYVDAIDRLARTYRVPLMVAKRRLDGYLCNCTENYLSLS